MKTMMLNMTSAFVLALICVPGASAQVSGAAADQWASVRFLLGSWEGTSRGQPGTGIVRREYRLDLRDQYIEERNTTTYLPQEKNPTGEVHEHVSYISHDRARRRLVLRPFHVERFVIQYVEERESSEG